MEFQGTVIDFGEAKSGTSARGDWHRQEVIFEMMDGQYSRKVAVTFFNKQSEIEALQKGTTYNVSFNLESREFNGRWYTDVRAWRVVVAGAEAPAAQPQAAAPAAAPVAAPVAAAPATSAADEVDDLPF